MLLYNLLGDNKPDVSDADFFNPMLNELNTDLLDCNLITFYHVFEIKTLFWNAIANEFKSLVIEGIIVQLRDDLKLKHPDSVAAIRTLQDVHDGHNSVNGAVGNEISWKSTHVQFYDKDYGLNIAKGMKADCGVNC